MNNADTQKLIKKFNNNGYLVVKNFLKKKQINELLNGFETNLNFCISNFSKIKFKNLDEKYIWLQKNYPLIKSRAYDVSKYHQSLYKISSNKKLDKFLQKYFDEKYYYLDLPQIRADDNSNSRALPMHQELYGQLSKKIVTLWIPLTDVSVKNGTMGIVQNSHNLGILKHTFYKIKKNKYHGVTSDFMKNKKILYFKLKAGDGVLFHPLLVHGTGRNYSKNIRWTYVVRLNALSGIEYLTNERSSLRIKQN
jgi:ectoine hydroxylase-related dioxygenase (phytanoyl-CoA dioxygenase family)